MFSIKLNSSGFQINNLFLFVSTKFPMKVLVPPSYFLCDLNIVSIVSLICFLKLSFSTNSFPYLQKYTL